MERSNASIEATASLADEAALLAQLRAGDDGAFDALVRTYGGRLLAVAQRMLGSEDDARDALQDAFLSAFKSIHSFSGDSRISTWLHRIVVNASLMKLRSRKSRPMQSIEGLLPTFLEDGHQAQPAVEWPTSAPAEMERDETRALVRRCIEQLPEGYRVVLQLRDIEGLDTDATAAILGIEPNAAKTRLHRARQALRTLLDPHFRGDRAMTCREVLDFLMDYVDAVLPNEQRAVFEEHLAKCAPCQNYLASYRKTVDLCSEQGEKKTPIPEDLVKAILAARKGG